MLRAAALLSSVTVAGTQLLLRTASPVQPLVDRLSPTHSFCNQQACQILRSDGLEHEAFLFQALRPQLELGSDWADSGWRNIYHYYDPNSRSGLWRYPSAAQACTRYFNKALKWFHTQPERAFFYLGAATHLVQDVCVPHHASGQLWNGHREFEARAAKQRFLYPCWDYGEYWISDLPWGWIDRNANQAKKWLASASEGASSDSLEETIANLLPVAQRSTAGFWRFFLDAASLSGGACYEMVTRIKEEE